MDDFLHHDLPCSCLECVFFVAALSLLKATAGVLRSHSLVHCSSDFNDHEFGSSVCFGWRGKLAEVGAPSELMQQADSRFAKLAQLDAA